MSHARSNSAQSGLSDLSTLTTSSTSSDVEIYNQISPHIEQVDSGDLVDAEEQAKALFDMLKADDQYNIFKIAEATVPQRLHLIFEGMLHCAPEPDSKQYLVKATLLCAKFADGDGRKGQERHKQLLTNLRALAVTWLTHFLFICESASSSIWLALTALVIVKSGSRSHDSRFERASDVATPTIFETSTALSTTQLGRRTLSRETVSSSPVFAIFAI